MRELTLRWGSGGREKETCIYRREIEASLSVNKCGKLTELQHRLLMQLRLSMSGRSIYVKLIMTASWQLYNFPFHCNIFGFQVVGMLKHQLVNINLIIFVYVFQLFLPSHIYISIFYWNCLKKHVLNHKN